MKNKLVNIQGAFHIPVEYVWIARNQNGVMNGFMNPPIRDYKTGEWQDCVTGDYGFFIPFDGWETSLRKVVELSDPAEVQRKRHRDYQNPDRDPSAPRCKRSGKRKVDNGIKSNELSGKKQD